MLVSGPLLVGACQEKAFAWRARLRRVRVLVGALVASGPLGRATLRAGRMVVLLGGSPTFDVMGPCYVSAGRWSGRILWGRWWSSREVYLSAGLVGGPLGRATPPLWRWWSPREDHPLLMRWGIVEFTQVDGVFDYSGQEGWSSVGVYPHRPGWWSPAGVYLFPMERTVLPGSPASRLLLRL